DRAVVDLLPGGVAPRRVEHLPDFALGHVAGDDAIEQPGRVAARDPVLVEWGDVEQRRRAADRVILAVVRQLVGAGDDEPRPAAPRQQPRQAEDRRHQDAAPPPVSADGSSASRSASPSSVQATTTRTSAKPGVVATQGALTSVSRPEAIMLPQDGVGGWTPRPR